MAPINSQTTNWQCGKNLNGIPCGQGNVITKTKCKNSRCGKERGRGDLAMSIMDEVLGIFLSRDEVDYDADAPPFAGSSVSYGGDNSGSGGGGGSSGGSGPGDATYRPARSAAEEHQQQAARQVQPSRRGRCT